MHKKLIFPTATAQYHPPSHPHHQQHHHHHHDLLRWEEAMMADQRSFQLLEQNRYGALADVSSGSGGNPAMPLLSNLSISHPTPHRSLFQPPTPITTTNGTTIAAGHLQQHVFPTPFPAAPCPPSLSIFGAYTTTTTNGTTGITSDMGNISSTSIPAPVPRQMFGVPHPPPPPAPHGLPEAIAAQNGAIVQFPNAQVAAHCQFGAVGVGASQVVVGNNNNNDVARHLEYQRCSSFNCLPSEHQRLATNLHDGTFNRSYSCVPKYIPTANPIQLWKFLLEMLLNDEHKGIIAWTGRGWEFKFIDKHEVARLWGLRKNKPRMNYEKLSRGLRYYYDKNIIHKTPDKRFTYCFVCDLTTIIGKPCEQVHAEMGIAPDTDDDTGSPNAYMD